MVFAQGSTFRGEKTVEAVMAHPPVDPGNSEDFAVVIGSGIAIWILVTGVLLSLAPISGTISLAVGGVFAVIIAVLAWTKFQKPRSERRKAHFADSFGQWENTYLCKRCGVQFSR